MLMPETEADLAEIVRCATGPLAVRGGGTRPIGRPVAGEVLSMAGIAGISLYEPGALTLVARAGTPVAEVETALAAEGQRLAFEPMDHRALLGTDGEPTIGGVVAGNHSGPRRVQAGACRDFLLGVRFVDGRGTVLKSGGRVMKNVTGYDLVKLLAGSRGTLGVLTEVSFKVLPKPDCATTLVLRGLAPEAGVAAMAAALGSPYEVTGAAHLTGDGGTAETMLRLEGFEAAVDHRAGELARLLGRFGAVDRERDPERVRESWRRVRDVTPFSDRPGAVWRISVRPSDGPAVLAAVPKAEAIFDWGGGLVWLLADEALDVRTALAGVPGHKTLVRASEARRAADGVFEPDAAPLAAIAAGLRAKFDPRGILNPGLMG